MFSQLPDGNNRVQAIEISTTVNPTCLINVYLPSRGTDSGHDAYRAALYTLKEIILKHQETHSIITAGDFNASFIKHYKDSQDELFKQFVKRMEWNFQLIKTQRSSSSQFTHTPQTPDKEASKPDDINELFKEHFVNLAKTNENPFFDKEHDNLVKLNAETIVKLCENEDITVQPVTS
ncbi:Hypothetical predicted protein [Mytilus galloprovincialis]|uniref:Endonuclease/exonuclease/phosphatase domain-containing protein n=1 Tax=Mytilus galloprovincialis TaxID=29158 RepID=A0A8B6BJV9_MYTGA|nr:Hypothetical predicted protein [Mytilus galloprovincialis]